MTKPKSIKRLAQSALTTDNKMREAANKSRNPQMTADSFQNFAAMLGIGTSNLMSASTYGFNPVTRVRTILEWIHRGSWLGGIAVDCVADDMTRAGVEIKGDLDPDQINQMEEGAVSFNIWGELNDTCKWARLYGGCIAVIMIDGQKFNTPFRVETVGRDQFRGLYVLDRWQVEPTLNNLVQEMGPQLGTPKFYKVQSDAPALMGNEIHYSRCIRLEGIRLPYWQRIMENMWGISVLERLYDRMVAFDSGTTGASQLLYKAFLRTYKIKGYREIVAGGGTKLKGLLKQMELMRMMQSNEGITLMDDEDSYEQHHNQSFAGIDLVLRQLGEQIAGALQVPLTRLFGQSPGGLDSSGDSDLRTYYDGINQQQNRYLLPGVTRAYRAMGQSLGIKLPPGFRLKFRPLWQLSEADKATIASANTESVVKAKDAGLISDQCALKELKQGSEVSGVFSNISREDIENAEDEPAPPVNELMPGKNIPEGEGGDPEEDEPKAKGKKKTGDSASMTKLEVHYTNRGTAAEHCAQCIHFLPAQGSLGPAECKLVIGEILPSGWCSEFRAK